MCEQEHKTILLVEDEMIIALESAKVIRNFGYTVIVANSGEKAVNIVSSNQDINLILMDIDLGKGIDGPQAARLVLEKRSIPIVFLTSHSEKEYVDRVKKITRYGYVIKNSGDFVLRSSIEMAFELFEANKRLHDSEESLSITFQSIGDAVIATDINGLITRMNSKAEFLTGWKFSDAKGQPLNQVFRIYNTNTRDILENPVARVLEKGENVALANHTVLIDKNGKEYQIADSAAPIRDNNGIIRGVIMAFSDFTEKYRVMEALRESEERYRAAFITGPDPIIISTIEGCWIDINASFTKLTGYEREDVIEKFSSKLNIWMNLELRRIWVERLQQYGVCENFETVMRCKDGHLVTVLLSSRIITINNIPHIFTVTKDITELLRSQQALQETEERYRIAFQTSPDAIAILTTEGQWVDINDSFVKMTGFTREEIVGKFSQDYNVWANPEDRKVWVSKLQEKGICEEFETQVRRKDGSFNTVLLSAGTIMINHEPHILSIARDITERKRGEVALRESEERYRAAFITSPDAFIISTIQGQWIDINESFTRLTGYRRDEILGKLSSDLDIWAIPGDREKWIELLMSSGSCENFKTVMLSKAKSPLNILLSSRIILINQAQHILTIAKDVTELLRAEQILRDSEERYRAAFFTSPDAVAISTISGKWIDINDSFTKLSGYTREEVVGKKAGDVPIWVKPEERLQWINILQEKGKCDDFEAIMRRKDNTLNIVLLSSRLITINNEIHIFSIAKNVTELKRKEQALRESEERYRAAFQTSPDAINITTLQGSWIDINESFTRITGFTRKDVIGKNSSEINIWTNPDDRQDLVKRLKEKGVYENLEIVLRCKDGSLITVLMSARIIKINNEPHILSISRDITGRKRVEQALRENEEWHKAILQTAMDGFWLFDMQGRLLEVNDTYCRMSGYSIQELLTMNISDLDARETSDNVISRIKHIIANGENRFETRHRRKDGSIFNVEVSVQHRPAEGGRLVAFLRNITELRQAENKLRQDMEERKTLLREVHLKIWNILNVISNLLNVQFSHLQTPGDALTAIKNSRERVNCIAILYEILYDLDDFTRLDMSEFLQKLTRYIQQNVDSGENIQIDVQAKGIILNVNTALTCGLLVCELLTNACKYAFPQGKPGNISVQMRSVEKNSLELSVTDNGIGLGDGDKESKRLGFALIHLFVTQLDASMNIAGNNGTHCSIVFPVKQRN